MSNLTLLEKLQLQDEKNLLIQGIPSSIEKQFAKLSYAKNVTPLVKTRKVDFVLIFAINQNQMINIMKEVLTATKPETKLWIAYPKVSSKIVSDLNRETSWDYFLTGGYEKAAQVDLDHMWSAIRFKPEGLIEAVVENETESKAENEDVIETKVAEKVEIKGIEFDKKLTAIPQVLEKAFVKHKQAKEIFSALSPSHQNEYLVWIEGAKKEETKLRRSESVIEKLMAGKKTPMQK